MLHTTLIAVLLTLSSAFAADVQSPRTAGLAGSGHAAPLLNDAIYVNPSYISYLRTYSFSAMFLGFSGDGGFHGRNYSISLMDGRAELLQAGIGFTVKEKGNYLHIAASRLVMPQISVGVGGKFFFDKREEKTGTNDFVFSATGLPNEWLQLSVIVDNIFEKEDGDYINWHREIILGSKWNILGIVLLYADPHYVPSLGEGEQFGYEAGLEFSLMQDFMLRGGIFKNAYLPFVESRGQGFAFGVGWLGPRISFDYSLSRMFESLESYPAALSHNGSITVFF